MIVCYRIDDALRSPEATAATAANAPRSSSRSGIVAIATLSALLLVALAVALGIFILRRRRRRACAVQSSFIHGSAESDSDSDVAPVTRAFSKEPQISHPRPVPASNRNSNVLDEENARLREAVARLQDQLEDLGHADDPSLPAYDSHSAASIHSYSAILKFHTASRSDHQQLR
ncbi:hypothetical protein EXIGLDRAFT_121778 [Exidia glandulosa HHB12029]|uniref:Uncharacterized protein n=1 Tax=Exidia glandulosa HHB12029 TaxID=1314781 RepID=A0A165GE44_EXIGL|nr:hypothetical protein EXIGLDRAFT_121778 [Exidia glandulosa HHB12029]